MSQNCTEKVEEYITRGQTGSEATVREMLAQANAALEVGEMERAANILDDRAVENALRIYHRDSSQSALIFELGELLCKTGREQKAEQCYRTLIELRPTAAAYNKLGCLCQYMGRMSEALEYQAKAVEAEPQSPQLRANYARVLMETGSLQEGIDLLRSAIEEIPDCAQAHSNLLFRLGHVVDMDAQALFDEHIRWARRHAPSSLAKASHSNVPDPDRRLRVGYISPDFRRHSVAYFFESLLDGHDREDVEVWGYGNVEFRDQITGRLIDKFDRYRDVRNLDDASAAQLIEQDRIDILVDLAGHMGDNRLGVLARKPVPIQVTYLGYPNTTGIEAIDYRLTDPLADTPDLQRFYTEELVFLGDGFLCYKPPAFAPPLTPLPAEKKGYVTFGSFNNSCKINPTIAKLWADVVNAAANSHLLLKFKGGDDDRIRKRYIDMFAGFGVAASRIDICGWRSPAEHLQTYARVDIALDTFPYNGTTTTCEASWMGVPTVSLVGNLHASRVGLSILTRLGLEFFAAAKPNEYVAKAAALAANLPALAQIRMSMRARMATGGLCSAKPFARDVEAAYREMWRRWCRSQSGNVVGGKRVVRQIARPNIGEVLEQRV